MSSDRSRDKYYSDRHSRDRHHSSKSHHRRSYRDRSESPRSRSRRDRSHERSHSPYHNGREYPRAVSSYRYSSDSSFDDDLPVRRLEDSAYHRKRDESSSSLASSSQRNRIFGDEDERFRSRTRDQDWPVGPSRSSLPEDRPVLGDLSSIQIPETIPLDPSLVQGINIDVNIDELSNILNRVSNTTNANNINSVPPNNNVPANSIGAEKKLPLLPQKIDLILDKKNELLSKFADDCQRIAMSFRGQEAMLESTAKAQFSIKMEEVRSSYLGSYREFIFKTLSDVVNGHDLKHST